MAPAMMDWVLRSVCHLLGHHQQPTVTEPSSLSSRLRMASDGGSQGQGDFSFRMPLHYPRYKKSDYENMEEWKLELLLHDYGLSFSGTIAEKRDFAMGAFLWTDVNSG
ncbi:hypothetical protein SAY87_022839 [Trapa incisa]|uniref:DUF7722 domain-containing protein n=2 Tax=Trapa TaxID=22665 RepID=A0AAN7LMD1_TRANT|nr:hypothetical protein SAY87_022839 [Trapa incisa]KAK4783685.1 hypothetical protein SAY86_008059 [Trapa natans]